MALIRPHTAACVVALLLMSTPVVAIAQAERSEGERVRVAQELYSDAMKAFESGKYEKAIEGFQAADALYPDPIFDYNIAVCWSALGKPMKALEAAERAAGEELPAQNAVKNEARIAAFRRLRRARNVGRAFSFVASSTRAPEHRDSSWNSLDTVSLGVAGVGLAGLGVTLWLNAEVSDLADDVEEANRSGDLERARVAEDEGRTTQTVGRIVGVASTVTLVSGVTWFLIRRLGGSEDESDLTWSVEPEDGGLRVVLDLPF